ncbi:MAG: hypothetical protein U1F57_02960 [bacterium]
MSIQSKIRKAVATALILYTSLGSVATSKADGLWNEAKSYTAYLADAAKTAAAAVATAAAALAAAKQDLATAQAAFAAANAAAATTAETVAAMESAAAAVTAAEATLATATTVSGVAAAVLAGATAGTLIGQGADWLISWCWDPVCDVSAMNVGNGPIYVPATDDEVNQLIPELVSIGSGQTMTVDDFHAAGDMGDKSLQFLSQEVRMFIGFARGAAAYSAGRDQEVLNAVSDLKTELNTFPSNLVAFSDVLQNTALQSPVDGIGQAGSNLEVAVEKAYQAFEKERSLPGADQNKITEAENLLQQGIQSFQSAQQKIEAINYPALVGQNAAFPNLTLDRFNKFISDCGTEGKACLPPEEVDLVSRLMKASGVYSPSTPDYGVEIAKWDAFFGDNSHEIALFGSSGSLNLAELLRKSATELTPQGGSWLGIDLEQSPLTIAARKTIPGNPFDGMSSSGGCSLNAGNPVSARGLTLLFGIFMSVLGFFLYRHKTGRSLS